MAEPTLVIMAAGMGSRYGGLKQIDPVGNHGELIIDYSLYDAFRAGFRRVVFIIKKAMEEDFRAIIGDRISAMAETHYAYQELGALPPGFLLPPGREKPWGTGHAVLCAREFVDGPFAVINADDYYGREAFALLYRYLKDTADDRQYRYSMVGYRLENTLTDHGHVARGVCVTGPDGRLLDVREHTRIERRGGLTQYTEDGGESWVTIPAGSIVSMNLWGFTPSIMGELEAQFSLFLREQLPADPLKGEFFLPTAVGALIQAGKAAVQVLSSPDRWYGVTYREDKPVVVEAMARLREQGVYPEPLWGSAPPFMNDYHFTLATHEDIPEILALYHSLIGTPGCTWNLDYPNKEIVESDIEHHSLYVLKDGDNHVISAAAAGVDDELSELHWTPKNPCTLARIGVLASLQNQGIGTVMLLKVINSVRARGFDGIIMLVSKGNSSALALYHKKGFKRCGETSMYGIEFYCYELLL